MKISLTAIATRALLSGCAGATTGGVAANGGADRAADGASLKAEMFADPAAPDMDQRIDRYLAALAREAKARGMGEPGAGALVVPAVGTTWTVSSEIRNSLGCGDPPDPACGRPTALAYRVVASSPDEATLSKTLPIRASAELAPDAQAGVTERWSPFGAFGAGGPRGIPFHDMFPLVLGATGTVRWTEPIPPAGSATIRRSCVVRGFAPVSVMGASHAAVQATCVQRTVTTMVYGSRTVIVSDLDTLPDLGIVGREQLEGRYASEPDSKTAVMTVWDRSEAKTYSAP